MGIEVTNEKARTAMKDWRPDSLFPPRIEINTNAKVSIDSDESLYQELSLPQPKS